MLVFHLFYGRVVASVKGIVLFGKRSGKPDSKETNIVKDRQGLLNKEVTYERKN